MVLSLRIIRSTFSGDGTVTLVPPGTPIAKFKTDTHGDAKFSKRRNFYLYLTV